MSEKKSFKDTLNLPTTSFPIRANAKEKEPELLKFWQNEDLYTKTFKKDPNKPTYMFHDGPPYANGHIHMGTAFNKIIKDIVCKSRRMMGYNVPFTPGYDCHGLPIEFKVTAELGLEKDKSKIDAKALKQACRAYAQKWIDVQTEEFKDLGALADWENPYKTMDPKYEASILKAFAKFVDDGYIERKGKTVPWCASCQTVLATAEIEYHDRKDPSCYIFFPADKDLFHDIDLEVGFLIWTTTPWTIPLNRAVVLNPSADYVVIEGRDKRAFIVAERLADKICDMLEMDKVILKTIPSSSFANVKVNHPFINDLKVPILFSDTVTLEDGTACMHMAPGCGPEDYLIAIKNGIEIYSPLTTDGKYDSGIEPKELEGISVVDGQVWVIKKLVEVNNLILKTSLRHSYPHCWRCRSGLMFRATKQWFCNLKKNDLVDRALKEVESITFVPEKGKTRLASTISSRTEWCISRQRYWGVPIPALICSGCDKAIISSELILKVAEGVAKDGIEYWNNFDASNEASCCGEIVKETDILDVWFDSGVSHYAVLSQNENLSFPADLYFEGSDQHRGWFQSSLLCSMVLNDKAQSGTIVTHGYVVDAKGHKMSKSLGNVVAPSELVKKYSRDITRLWAASTNYEVDMVLSDVVMKNVSEVYRKIRNTARFLISNLYDFDAKDKINIDQLSEIDKYALYRLNEINNDVMKAYENYDTPAIFHTLGNYCATDLSSFYLDIIKDRLYVEKGDGLSRRGAQTVCYEILITLTGLMAPILSFLAEEISQSLGQGSIHLQKFNSPTNPWEVDVDNKLAKWSAIKQLRSAVLKSLEDKRGEGVIKHSLEAKIKLNLNPDNSNTELISDLIDSEFLKSLFIVSQVELVDSKLDESTAPWITLKVDRADGVKCPRCWQWDVSEHPDELCRRCVNVLS